MNPETTLRFWLVALELLALLALFGYPISRTAARWSGGALALPPPLLGLPVVSLLSWWWVRATGLGLDEGVPVMAGVAVLAWLPILYGIGKRPPLWRDVARRSVLPVATVLAVAVLFTVHFSSVFRLDYLSSAAGANVDVSGYSLVAGQLVDEGLSGTGNVYGYDLSERAEGDAFGATALVAVAAVASGHETWEVGTAVLFVALFLLALALVALIRHLWPQAGLIAVLAALAGLANAPFQYLTFHFFLSQIIGIALLCGLVVALLASIVADSRRALAASVAASALIVAGMVATYPHMALLSPIVMLPVIAVCVRRAAWRQGILRLGTVAIGSVVLAIAVAPDQFANGVRRAEALGSVAAGWPLPALFPSHLFGETAPEGLGSSFGPSTLGPSLGAWVGSTIILGVLLGAALVRGSSDRLSRFVIAAWVVVLSSYVLVYLREGGESYRQWKWITFFLPLLVACGASLIMAAGLDLARRARLAPAQARAAVLAVLVVVVSFQTTRAHAWIDPWLGGSAPSTYVNPDLAAIATEPRIRTLSVVNVNAVNPIEAQWLYLLLRPLLVYAYPPPRGSNSPWTLERVGSRPTTPDVEVIPINATYQLTHEARSVPVAGSLP